MTDQRRRRGHHRESTNDEDYYVEEWPDDPSRTSANAFYSGASHRANPSLRPSRPVEPPRTSQGDRYSRLSPIIGVTRVIITHPGDDSSKLHFSAFGVRDGSNGVGDIRDDVRLATELHRRREGYSERNARRRSRRTTETTTFTMGGERPPPRRRQASPSPPPEAQFSRRPPAAPSPDPFETQRDSEYDDLQRDYAELKLSSGKRQRTGHEETAFYDRHRRPRHRYAEAEPTAEREPLHRGRSTDYHKSTSPDPYWAQRASSNRWTANARQRPGSKPRKPAGDRTFDTMQEAESVDNEPPKGAETQSKPSSEPTRVTDSGGSSTLGDSRGTPCGSHDDDPKCLPVPILNPAERRIPARLTKDKDGKIRFEACSLSFYLPGLEEKEDMRKAIDNPEISWALTESRLGDPKVRKIVGFTQDGSWHTSFTLDNLDSPFFERSWETFLLRYRSVDVKPATEPLDNGSIRISFDLELGTHVKYVIAEAASQFLPLRDTESCWRVRFDPSSGTAMLCLSISARPPETARTHFWPVPPSLNRRFWELWRHYEPYGWDENPSCDRG